MERCDNRSVGVVLRNQLGQFALLTRRKFPPGIAPPAGHIDTHGTAEQAAYAEVLEELGVQLPTGVLIPTVITNRRVYNRCRRPGGAFHDWTVYEAQVGDVLLVADPDETRGAAWYDPAVLQKLADRTAGNEVIEFSADNPGIEPVWHKFLVELGHVALTER